MKPSETMPPETNQAPPEALASPPVEQTPLPAGRVLTKLFFLVLLSALPMWFCVMLSIQIIETVYDIRVNLDGDAAPEEAVRYEQAARDAIRPVLAGKYGLKDFDVKYTRPGWYAGDRRICDAGGKTERALRLKIIVPDEKRVFEIVEDIARIKRETPALPQCPHVLEFAYLLPDQTGEADGKGPARYAPRRGLVAIVIPDAASGYNGRWKWHTDDFTPADGLLAANTEARE